MTRPGSARGRRDERGSMAVEVVLLTPLLVMCMLLVVAGGRYVETKGDIDAAARDAARAASYQRTYSAAQAAADAAAAASLDDDTTCTSVTLTTSGGGFAGGNVITARLHCQVSWAGLGLIGLPGTIDITGVAKAPLDTYRRTG